MKRLKPLDIVRTAFGTLCVVDQVSTNGDVSLVLPLGSSQKSAWYEPSELVFVGSVKDVVAKVPGLDQSKPKREKAPQIRVWNSSTGKTEDLFGNILETLNGMN